MAGSGSMDGQMLAEAIGLEDAGEALEMVRGLLGSGVDPNARGWDGHDGMTVALWSGRWDIVRVMLDHGATRSDDNFLGYHDPLLGLAMGGPLDLCADVVDRFGGWSCLFLEGYWAWPSVRENPIALLISDRQFGRLEELWITGIDTIVDVTTYDLGRTPLAEAAASGDAEGIRWLISHGANVNHQDEGSTNPTALECAGECPSLKATRLLLAAGANPNIPTWMWRTAVERAVRDSKELEKNDPKRAECLAIRDALLKASTRFPAPVYPDGTSPEIWPPVIV